jgi:uncharacterized iron-regulated membrane protein
MQSSTQKSGWPKVRKFFNDIHLWIGIASGLILFVVCLSGTIYTFSAEITEMTSPEKYKVTVAPGAKPLLAEEIIARVQEATQGKVTALTIPADETRAYQLNVKKVEKKEEGKTQGATAKGGGGPGGGRGTNYLVDPYTGEVKGTTEGAAATFFMTMFRLHRWLLLETEVGRPIVGWATVIFVLLIISGWVIWFPAKLKSWKQGLKIKTSANWKRVNHDLHNALGFYSSFLLMIMALTGLTWSFESYKAGFLKVLGVPAPGATKEMPVTSTPPAATEAFQPLLMADYLQVAEEILPYKGNYRITLPADSAATVSIFKNQTGFFAPAAADRLQLDQYSGQPLKTDIFADKAFNEKIAASIKPLHLGDVFGTFSKILYFITCLIATSLPVTGTMIWINKLRKKGKKNAAPASGPKGREVLKAN